MTDVLQSDCPPEGIPDIHHWRIAHFWSKTYYKSSSLDKINIHKNHWTKFTGLSTRFFIENFWHHKVAINIT